MAHLFRPSCFTTVALYWKGEGVHGCCIIIGNAESREASRFAKSVFVQLLATVSAGVAQRRNVGTEIMLTGCVLSTEGWGCSETPLRRGNHTSMLGHWTRRGTR